MLEPMPPAPLADNLRRLRTKANLTQAELASSAGLPRASLAAMERPGANPGVQGVLAVAQALGVSIEDLLNPPPAARHYLVTPADQQEYRAEGGRFVARLASPISAQGLALHDVTMLPGCRSIGRPHPRGAQEFFYCLEGTCRITIEDEAVDVPAGCLLQFPGHLKHIYGNPGTATVRAVSCVALRL